MIFDKDVWIYGIWFCGDGTGDYQATLAVKDDQVIMEYRFLYYKDDNVGDESQDEKHWYEAKMKKGDPDGLKKAIAIQERLLSVIEAQYGSKADFVDLQCRGDDPKVFFELGSRPWCHLKIEGKEQP